MMVTSIPFKVTLVRKKRTMNLQGSKVLSSCTFMPQGRNELSKFSARS
jgi:hypothetical protein